MIEEPHEVKHLVTTRVEETTLIAEDVAADASLIKPGEGLDVEEVVASTDTVIMDVEITILEVEEAAVVVTVDAMDADIMIVDLIEAEEPMVTSTIVMIEVSVKPRGETLLLVDYPTVSLLVKLPQRSQQYHVATPQEVDALEWEWAREHTCRNRRRRRPVRNCEIRNENKC